MSQKLILDLGWPPTKFTPLSFISVDSLVLNAVVDLDGPGATDSEQSRRPPHKKKAPHQRDTKGPLWILFGLAVPQKKKKIKKKTERTHESCHDVVKWVKYGPILYH